MIDKEKAKLNMKRQWTKLAIVTVLYLAFLYWVKSWWGLLAVPFIYDVYITKKIRWQWWRDSEGVTRFVMSWVDAIVFALVAVYFINLYFFQNYVIPSSSLEKSLLTGDYLFVSKMSYGPRKPMTPLTLPLTQHTLPVLECKSYIEWPQWGYERAKGLGKIEQGDIVVFNYPAGDTLCSAAQWQAQDFYQMAYSYGYQLDAQKRGGYNLDPGTLTPQRRRDYFDYIYGLGRAYITEQPAVYGDIVTRPVDRRENYVKRCVGLPGQVLQIKNRTIYTDGKALKEPDNAQYTYTVKLKAQLPEDLIEQLGISMEDLGMLNREGVIPLTAAAASTLGARKDLVSYMHIVDYATCMDIYPLNGHKEWTRDDFGPVWIPKKGKTLHLTMDNIAIYERCIRTYEGHSLEVKDSKIYIDGKQTSYYTFAMDYYWMMGDNRHNSLDSRYWGFVPEDHIVGKPIFIWWSSDPDRHGFGGIRWSRLFRLVDNIR